VFILICKPVVLSHECGLNKRMTEPENGVSDSAKDVSR
jgi:hypothetical protein